MDRLTFPIEDILSEVADMMPVVSSNIFIENRPKTVSEQLNDMVVVSLPYQFHNEGAWQRSSIRFELIVRERQGGIPPVDKLQDMLDSLTEMFPIVGTHFVCSKPFLALKGSDGIGWTIWNVQAKIKVNTTNRYNWPDDGQN